MDQGSVELLAASRYAAFAAARMLVEQWRASGRRTTTAGVTSAMKREGELDLDTLGMRSNREFWDHAVESGVLSLAQQPNGHWLLLLPGERLEDLTPAPTDTVPTGRDQELRLKNDVWTSFVDWNPAYRRFWDRDHARAFMSPDGAGWIPATVDTTRFVEIRPARRDTQFGWMVDFAGRLEEPERTAVLATIGEDAARGAFSRELRERGLSRAWRSTLRDRIIDLALAWANEASIDIASIMETRPRPGSDSQTGAAGTTDGQTRAERPPAGRPRRASRGSDHETTREGHGTGVTPGAGSPDPTELLRERLHRVLDNMGWDELSEVTVRAKHLLHI